MPDLEFLVTPLSVCPLDAALVQHLVESSLTLSQRERLFFTLLFCANYVELDFESYRALASKNSQSTQECDMHIKWPEYSVPECLQNSCVEGLEHKLLTLCL